MVSVLLKDVLDSRRRFQPRHDYEEGVVQTNPEIPFHVNPNALVLILLCIYVFADIVHKMKTGRKINKILILLLAQNDIKARELFKYM